MRGKKETKRKIKKPRKADERKRPRKAKFTPKGAKHKRIKETVAPIQKDGIPRTFVIKKGSVPKPVRELVTETRRIMEPHTASNLKEKSTNSLKDFLQVSSQLGISHFLVFSTASSGTIYLRLAKSPHGPTLNFEIEKYSLIKDVRASQLRPQSDGPEFFSPPLVVLNNFSNQPGDQFKLMSSMIQGMFPPLNVQKIKLAECRRVVLFEYSEEFGTIDVRHYLITLAPQGISKGVKKMLKRKPNQSLPDLSKYQDISEFLENQSGYTESDAEDDPDSKVRIIDEKHIKHQISQQSAIRLKEIGPRMQLRLASISDGFCSGEIIFTSAHQSLHGEEGKEKATESVAIQEQIYKRNRPEKLSSVLHQLQSNPVFTADIEPQPEVGKFDHNTVNGDDKEELEEEEEEEEPMESDDDREKKQLDSIKTVTEEARPERRTVGAKRRGPLIGNLGGKGKGRPVTKPVRRTA